MMGNTINNEKLLVQYKCETSQKVGYDSSIYKNHAIAYGENVIPQHVTIEGREAVTLAGGKHGSSYLQLPSTLLSTVNDYTGLTVTSWIYLFPGQSVWERLFDFGAGPQGPYLFLTRNLRGVCFGGSDIAVDPNKSLATGEWIHIAMTVSGTEGATVSNAGPILYVNGEMVADGSISQTTSGTYLKYREWIAAFDHSDTYCNNYIGHSQFDADHNFHGAFTDFRVYNCVLSHAEIVDMMCESLSDEQLVDIAAEQDLALNSLIITQSIALPTSILNGQITIEWTSSNPNVLQHDGEVNAHLSEAYDVTLTAKLIRGQSSIGKTFELSVLPTSTIPYEIIVDTESKGVEVSPVMYGLFYEDINNAADGGIYAELIRNRSFESFTFDSFSHVCGENAHSTGRKRTPLDGWYGDLNLITVEQSGGLNEYFSITDADVNNTYVTVSAEAKLFNRGFNDSNHYCAMSFISGENYNFTIWAKAEAAGSITVQLLDDAVQPISDALMIAIIGDGQWHKYGVTPQLELKAKTTTLGQISLHFDQTIAIDMISLFPQNVWGATSEVGSATAQLNYKGNANYRLRKDMVVALQNMKPSFLRFPGGCISEGSHVWDNVYDWKHSVGDVETRKENFNVWGYMMTLGLGYMEYFQLAEDLNATPLPVMACGVLCQARSDYANPAGGALRDYYIKNFTDLIDFAISEDFEHNEWAQMRKAMGHPAPFDLRYLGVGNENWGTEFFANFEKFKVAIDHYMQENYPSHPLTIISTVGAQADDDAYQQGWKFISGAYEGSEVIAFTDGCRSTEEHITWYEQQDHYMDTIVDEHYYRSNDYLLRNADRYNYYYRAIDANGQLDEVKTSKVFVGEYASNDKNTLAGAIAEAAVMTGFENNADVVRLAAYAPLFNKVLTDGTYRWTPDCIWFDDESIWFTPNYYVQQMFASYLGTQVLSSQYHTYRNGKSVQLAPQGGIQISTVGATLSLKYVAVISNESNNILFEQDFTQPIDDKWQWLSSASKKQWIEGEGLLLVPSGNGRAGIYIDEPSWSNYRVKVIAEKVNGSDGIYVGVGLTAADTSTVNVIEYVIGEHNRSTGLKVFKQGIEAYTLGDFSSSTMVGNMRAAYNEQMLDGQTYQISVNYGGSNGKELSCTHAIESNERDLQASPEIATLRYKLEAYNNEIFYSITRDEKAIYIKLVNSDATAKPLQIGFGEATLKTEYCCIQLTGDAGLLHTPNVNKKAAELITPLEQTYVMQDGQAILELPANSVQVLILEFI